MDLSLINQSICESKLYRATGSFKRLTGEEVAKALYLNTLVLIMLAQDANQDTFAKKYAIKTGQNGPYVLFRSSATDIYALAFQVNAPENNSSSMSDDDRAYLKMLSFDNRRHQRMMSNLGSGSIGRSELSTLITGLERQLKIHTHRYKGWRRSVLNWNQLPATAKAEVARLLKRELQIISSNGELYAKLNTMVNYGIYNNIDDKRSKLGTVAAIALGAKVGRELGRELGKRADRKLKKKQDKEDKYKKLGTGLGAVAGYWANKNT